MPNTDTSSTLLEHRACSKTPFRTSSLRERHLHTQQCLLVGREVSLLSHPRNRPWKCSSFSPLHIVAIHFHDCGWSQGRWRRHRGQPLPGFRHCCGCGFLKLMNERPCATLVCTSGAAIIVVRPHSKRTDVGTACRISAAICERSSRISAFCSRLCEICSRLCVSSSCNLQRDVQQVTPATAATPTPKSSALQCALQLEGHFHMGMKRKQFVARNAEHSVRVTHRERDTETQKR